MAGIYKRDLTF